MGASLTIWESETIVIHGWHRCDLIAYWDVQNAQEIKLLNGWIRIDAELAGEKKQRWTTICFTGLFCICWSMQYIWRVRNHIKWTFYKTTVYSSHPQIIKFVIFNEACSVCEWTELIKPWTWSGHSWKLTRWFRCFRRWPRRFGEGAKLFKVTKTDTATMLSLELETVSLRGSMFFVPE